jgi:hypothetical protein
MENEMGLALPLPAERNGRCAHCGERIKRNTRTDLTQYAFPCPLHGSPGVALKRGVPRCTVCPACNARMTAEAPRG